jgi:hypothetical protein
MKRIMRMKKTTRKMTTKTMTDEYHTDKAFMLEAELTRWMAGMKLMSTEDRATHYEAYHAELLWIWRLAEEFCPDECQDLCPPEVRQWFKEKLNEAQPNCEDDE